MAAPSQLGVRRTRGAPAAPRGDRIGLGLAAIVGVALVARFATLDVQSLWFDESVTASLVKRSLGNMLATIPNSESTPPLYYVCAWLWTRLWGSSEFALRSFSALCGTAAVPVFYAVGRRMLSQQTGLTVAALGAVSPLLIWYSQEARAYALFVLLTAGALLFFLSVRDAFSRRHLAFWAVLSALALATHYFAIFLVLPEAVWLLRARATRREVAIACAVPVAAAAALAPLAIHQQSLDLAVFITETPLEYRLVQVAKQLTVGFGAPAEVLHSVVAALLVLAGLGLLVWRGTRREHRRAAGMALLGAFAVFVPLLLAIGGHDYIATRNLLGAWLPLALVVAAGLSAGGRLGTLAAVALVAVLAAVFVAVELDSRYQRDNWRGAAEALGPATEPRAIVLMSTIVGGTPFTYYAHGTRQMAAPEPVQEIDLVSLPQRGITQLGRVKPPRPRAPGSPFPGFAEVAHRYSSTFTVIRYRAAAPLPVVPASLVPVGQAFLGIDPRKQGVVLQQAPRTP